jgi:itaconate CoA-transferase
MQGLLVLSIEQAVAGPMCTLRLADSGARVIKIERPDGDTARQYDRAVNETSAYFAWLNRGKESLVLDLKTTTDLDLAFRILSKADIFVQNLVPGAAARLGLASADLTERFPRLVAVDIVGYGQDTAYRSMRAYDMLIQAESGLCSVTGTPEAPAKVGVSAADIVTGMNAHSAILESIYHREKTGRGCAIEIAMFDGMAEWMSVPLLHYEHLNRVTPRVGLAHAQIYPYGRFHCRDGDVVIAVQNASEWRRFCAGVLLRPDLIDDVRFRDNPARVKNREPLDRLIGQALGEIDCSELTQRLETQRLAWSRYATIEDLARHPALRRIAVETPDGMEFTIAAPPFQKGGHRRRVPALGEHSDRIRTEFGGAPRGGSC